MNSFHGKRLVIFGCGYVGSALARAALIRGARIEVLTRNREKADELRAAGLANVVVAELSTDQWHRQIEGGADFVVNCVSSGGTGTGGYLQSYVEGMRSIIAWAVKGGTPAGTIVYTSSTSVYPQGNGATVDESVAADGATPTGRIIRESEMILQKASAAACQRWFILRLAGIYGPGRHHLLDQLRSGTVELPGSDDYHLNLVHRDDIVTAVLACLSAPSAVGSDVFNVADAAPALRGDVVRWLAGRVGRGMPAFDGGTGARRSGLPMPDRIISSGRISRTLGWRPEFPDYRAGFDSILHGG